MSDVAARLATSLSDRYRVERQIGIGGMATVYLAHDLRHERDVAIKVLHPDLAAALGAERFLAEIKTTAKLQHPHILPLLDSGEADGLLYYVMPYVAGESLRVRLERETQLSVEDAVRIAREVAAALESAHRHGVVHRDIKPENILLHEDQALVADFGIALAVSAAGGARMTQTGLSLGTPAYMAPEQAMGERVIDGRADIYALGAVLYEMLVGEAPFTGPTVQAIVARVMTEQPRALTSQRKSVPEHVNAAVMHALEKLPADRFPSAGDFGKALASPGFEAGAASSAHAPTATRGGRIPASQFLPWTIAALAVLAAVVFVVRTAVEKSSTRTLHFAVDLPTGMSIDRSDGSVIGISPDGSMLALSVETTSGSQLVLRSLATDETRVIAGAEGSGGSADFSPDGRWVAYNTDASVFKAPVAGGPATRLIRSEWAHIAWVGAESLVSTRNYDTGLTRFSADGRDSSVFTTPDRSKGELGHWWPQALPDGQHILFTTYKTPADRSDIEIVSLDDGERRVVIQGAYFGRYSDGRLIFTRGRELMSVEFDPGALRVSGEPVLLGLDVETNPTNGWAAVAVSQEGTLAYRTSPDTQVEIKWTDEAGREEPAIAGAGGYSWAAASPDGRKIGVIRDGDVWVYDIGRQLSIRLTRTEQNEQRLTWSPDSRTVFYNRDVPQFDIFARDADGNNPERVVVTSPHDKNISGVTRDGKFVIYGNDDADNDLFMAPVDSADGAPRRLIGGPGNQDGGRVSPDGMWIIHESNDSGRNEVYLAPYPADRAPGGRQQLSVGGGTGARWGPDGRTVYFSWAGKLYRVRVNPRTGGIGRPDHLAQVPVTTGWDIGPDGRFLVGRRPATARDQVVKVVLNWASMIDP